VKPPAFDYSRPETLEEAVGLLAELSSGGKVLAGGQSLLPILSMRLAAPEHLVDINRIAELDTISAGPDGVRLGALARHAAVERDPAVRSTQPLIPAALRQVAHPTIRNRGTTLGSIVHADPSGEMPAVLALLGGSVTAVSARGRRTISVAEFFLGPLESALGPDEIAVEAYFPALAVRSGTAFAEVSRRHGDYAVCGVAALVSVDQERRITSARAGYLSIASTPLVLDLTEAVLGRRCADDLSAAGRLARQLVEPDADIHASADYRRDLAGVLSDRVITEAARAAAGSGPGD
jgi:carbon-monoxide dehydrogenase medium subunit